MGKASRREKAVRRQIGRALPKVKSLRLPDVRDLHLPDVKDLHLPELHAPEIDWGRGRMGSRAAALWPALFAAAGAGAAVWWWNSWARGRAEADAAAQTEDAAKPEVERSPEDRQGGAEGAAAPEQIMAHAPPPAEAEEEAAPSPKPRAARKPRPTVDAQAQDALDESLAVQGEATAPAPRPER